MEMLTPIGKKRLAAWVVMLFIGMLVACFAPQRVSAQELSLDDVTIQSFKIIDTTHGDAEIEYSLSSDASPKTDPAAFSNAICQDHKISALKLEAKVAYNSSNAIQDGDTLTIPAKAGVFPQNFAPRPLLDSDNNQLGTFEYTDGNFVLKFSGDHLKNYSIKKFTITLQTGELWQQIGNAGYTTTQGERALITGKLGKDTLYTAYEEEYVVADTIGTTSTSLWIGAPRSSDHDVTWYLSVSNDVRRKDGNNFQTPYMQEHNGAYNPNSLTGIYMEDTFTDCSGEPDVTINWIGGAGVDDQGKVISGNYPIPADDINLLTKVDQGTKSKSEVKAALQNGQYCMYNNHDGSYTLMLKWWDMNDPAGPKYDDIPAIAKAGGVGSYMKIRYKNIFGNLTQSTIDKINQTFSGKAIQVFNVKVRAPYSPINTTTERENSATLTSDQETFSKTVKKNLTPSSATIDAPADPLTIKMLKTDKDSGAALSTGFAFKLQSSNDGGASWTDVTVAASMLDAGSLNPDGTLIPDANGAIQVKGLTGGIMYRFVEVSHANGYPDVTVDEANPNDADHTTSANSKAVTVTSQGSGQVITMYNQKAKVDVSGVKTWNDDNNADGVRPASITVNLLRDGAPVDSKEVTPDASGKWTYSFSDLAQYDTVDGHQFKYTITENAIADYSTVINGYNITNTHTPGKTSVTATKAWDDNSDADGIRPASVQFQLYANGTPLGAPVTVTKDDSWMHTWTNLNEKESGTVITYTVKEVDVPSGYTSAITGDATSGFTITNTHTPETVDISGTKTWDDANDQDGKRPQTITVNLLANGQKVAEKQVTEADGWTYSFTGMPKNKDGHEITYTVTENAVEGYTATVTGTNITNTHTPETTDISATKVWSDKDDQDKIRPTNVKVQLYADGVAQGAEVELSAANNWTTTWSGLDVYKGGKKITYSVEEVSVPEGYTSKTTATDATHITITNTHTPKETPTTPDSKQNPKPKGGKSSRVPNTGDTASLETIFILGGAAIVLIGISFALRLKKRA